MALTFEFLLILTYPWSSLGNESEGQGNSHFSTFAQLSEALWLNICQTYEIFFHNLYYKIYIFGALTRKYLFNNAVYNQQERKKGKLLTNLSVLESILPNWDAKKLIGKCIPVQQRTALSALSRSFQRQWESFRWSQWVLGQGRMWEGECW